MRALAFFALLFLCGCGGNVSKQVVSDALGSNRLVLIDRRVSSVSDVVHGHQSYNFHSLVLQTNAGGKWTNRVVITKAAFQGSSARARWVSEIQGLDSTNGTAIIKVAEEEAPTASPMIRIIYSWREWSLLTNREVRLVRICADPFEKY